MVIAINSQSMLHVSGVQLGYVDGLHNFILKTSL